MSFNFMQFLILFVYYRFNWLVIFDIFVIVF